MSTDLKIILGLVFAGLCWHINVNHPATAARITQQLQASVDSFLNLGPQAPPTSEIPDPPADGPIFQDQQFANFGGQFGGNEFGDPQFVNANFAPHGSGCTPPPSTCHQ